MMPTAVASLILLSATVLPVQSAPSRAVVAPDGARRTIDWQDSSITTDVLVLYTPQWDDATPDNRWARSCVVRDSVVVEVTNGAAAIPDDGFVLTGHGASASWLAEHLHAGDTVRLETAPPLPTETHERDVDAVDPQTTVFPSGRGPDQLVVYTPAFGERTGTNIFGSESVVRDGRIVERTGGDSVIPDDGFVISGHGRGSAWNMRNCPVGARVALDRLHLTVTTDREAYVLRAAADVDQAARRIGRAEAEGIDCPLESAVVALEDARELLAKAREHLETDPAAAEEALEQARRSAWTAMARASETREDEARGVWMSQRRVLASAERRRTYFARLRSANITMILPLIGAVLDQPDGEQILRDTIADAHAADVEVHPWTWLPAHPIPRSKQARLLEEHPEWQDVSLAGEPTGGLDLANPNVREALVADAVWLATNFDIDGLHMDWEGMRGGFSEIGRAQFEAEHGYDPAGDGGPTGPHRTRDLYLWRVSLVDRVVSELVDALRRQGWDRPLSSAVQCFNFHPNIDGDSGASQQWIRWCARGQLDIACPMVYAQNVGFVAETSAAMHQEIDGRCLQYTGLILYPETARSGLITPYQLLEQIDAARAAGSEGIILFAGQQLFSPPWTPDDRLLLTLREGPFRSRATLPHRDWKRPPLTPDAQVGYLYAVATPEQTEVTVPRGNEARVAVIVRNLGSEAFTISGATLTWPRQWEARMRPGEPVLVRPGGEATIGVIVRAPADAGQESVELGLRIVVEVGAVDKSIAVSAIRASVPRDG